MTGSAQLDADAEDSQLVMDNHPSDDNLFNKSLDDFEIGIPIKGDSWDDEDEPEKKELQRPDKDRSTNTNCDSAPTSENTTKPDKKKQKGEKTPTDRSKISNAKRGKGPRRVQPDRITSSQEAAANNDGQSPKEEKEKKRTWDP